MNTTTDSTGKVDEQSAGTGACAVTAVVVRLAGELRPRLDLTHAGTPEQQLGLSIATTLVYLGAAVTAEAITRGWADAAPLVRSLLQPAVPGRRPRLDTVVTGPVGVMVRLGGVPHLVSSAHPARVTGPAMVRIKCGPVLWDVLDQTAYGSMLAAWRRAAVLLGAVDDETAR